MAIDWKNYSSGNGFDELITAGGRARTGAGKSPLTQWLAAAMVAEGVSVAVLRHPMPYGNLALELMGKKKEPGP